MTVPFSACQFEIEHLCGYIKDNGYIASYFGIPRDVVENVRKGIKPRQRRAGKSLAANAAPISDSGTFAATARTDAEIASDNLRRAIESLFHAFERKHGLQEGAGAILLPAGWGGWE